MVLLYFQKNNFLDHTASLKGTILMHASTSLASSPIIYDELQWAWMETRSEQRRIFTFHKIIHGRSPPYLRNLLPPFNRERSTLALRNSDDLTTIHARLHVFYKSYFPQTVREWNTLSIDIGQIEEPEPIRRAVTKTNPSSNLLFYHGKCKFNIIHSRLRIGCSKLKAHLFQHHVDSPAGMCGNPYEDPFHYL